MLQPINGRMETFKITNAEIVELKQTMGFRVDAKMWNDLAGSYPDGCTNLEMIEFVKKWANPPYEVTGDLDGYLEKIMKTFIKFIRG